MADSIRLEASAHADALSKKEWQQLLEAAEESGSLRRSAIAEILDQFELEPLELDPSAANSNSRASRSSTTSPCRRSRS